MVHTYQNPEGVAILLFYFSPNLFDKRFTIWFEKQRLHTWVKRLGQNESQSSYLFMEHVFERIYNGITTDHGVQIKTE